MNLSWYIDMQPNDCQTFLLLQWQLLHLIPACIEASTSARLRMSFRNWSVILSPNLSNPYPVVLLDLSCSSPSPTTESVVSEAALCKHPEDPFTWAQSTTCFSQFILCGDSKPSSALQWFPASDAGFPLLFKNQILILDHRYNHASCAAGQYFS